jgi:hypothetical protein
MSEESDRRLPIVPASASPNASRPKSRRVGTSADASTDGPVDGGATGTEGVTRRTAIKVMAAAATLPVLASQACGAPPAVSPAPPSNPLARGTAFDPDLIAPTVPWSGVLSPEELRTVAALCDVIIPGDDRSPAASEVSVPAFIDEWISAPYPSHQREQTRIRGGLLWLDTEARERFGAGFADLELAQKHAICDDICYVPDAAPEYRAAALFFDRFRDLASTGFWTTEEGMTDLGYVGNVPLATWEGAPPEVLERLGLV